MTRALARSFLLAVAICSVLSAAGARAQIPRRTTRVDDDARSRLREETRVREAHCAEVGQAVCEREQREATRAWDRQVSEAEAAHCAEVGPARCREERAALVAEERRGFYLPLAIGAVLLGILGFRLFPRKPSRQVQAPISPDRRDLVALDVALGHQAAQSLRSSLMRAGAASSASDLKGISELVTGARARWTHVAVRSWPMASADDAELRFRSVRQELDARASLEVGPPPRDAGDGYRGEPLPLPAAALEPLVLLSITVLSSQEIPEPNGTPDERALAVLASLRSLSPRAVEVVDIRWLPDHAAEALSEHELVARQPRLVPLSKRA